MPSSLRELFWPVLEDWSPSHRVESHDSRESDADLIQRVNWTKNINLAVDEARRIAAAEEDRKKTAETKASNLLLVAVALIPLLIYTSIPNDASLTFQSGIETFFLLAGVIYLARTVLWAFWVVSTGTFHRVYPVDLVDIWEKSLDNAPNELVAELLSSVRRNQDAINGKVSALKMAHEFLLRSFISLLVLYVLRNLFGWL